MRLHRLQPVTVHPWAFSVEVSEAWKALERVSFKFSRSFLVLRYCHARTKVFVSMGCIAA